MTAEAALRELRALGHPDTAKVSQSFFKTGTGEYSAGDIFIGVRVPATRKLAARYRELPLDQIAELLRAAEHEARLLALIILTLQYAKGDAAARQRIFDFYLAHTKYINNWDLVDTSAAQIVGAHLWAGDTGELYELARSRDLWERRIAMIATMHFIKRGDYQPALTVAELLLTDEHDLIHKAVGWMLREVGNRDRDVEESFLRRHHQTMPRTMLRYAIEKFPPDLRAHYMKKA